MKIKLISKECMRKKAIRKVEKIKLKEKSKQASTKRKDELKKR